MHARSALTHKKTDLVHSSGVFFCVHYGMRKLSSVAPASMRCLEPAGHTALAGPSAGGSLGSAYFGGKVSGLGLSFPPSTSKRREAFVLELGLDLGFQLVPATIPCLLADGLCPLDESIQLADAQTFEGFRHRLGSMKELQTRYNCSRVGPAARSCVSRRLVTGIVTECCLGLAARSSPL